MINQISQIQSLIHHTPEIIEHAMHIAHTAIHIVHTLHECELLPAGHSPAAQALHIIKHLI